MTTSKDRNGGQWTEARFRGFVISALRAASRKWPPKWETIKEACVGQKKSKTTKRLAKHYRCAGCLGEFTQTGIQVDHIIPIGSCDTFDKYIERLFCEKSNLQVLCKKCHKIKTKKEKIENNQS